jgi:catechol 2,3-dioxygenase-like lactoylglutathione lyase family enzyme
MAGSHGGGSPHEHSRALRRSHLRIARPVTDVQRSTEMYRRGLGLKEIGRFEDHDGFDGVMLGAPGQGHHFEFTRSRRHPVTPAPTPEDLIVVYVPDRRDWEDACASMAGAGFVEVASFNPYWKTRGRTFEDHDRYRIVVCNEAWNAGEE